MERLQNSFLSIEQMTGAYLHSEKKAGWINQGVGDDFSFRQILEQASEQSLQADEVTFSKHANERLASRNINLDSEQMRRLNEGVMQAKEKCIKESLVMMDNIAFIVNVKNNTVITAMDQTSNDNNVFTNIDGAVIV